MIVAVVLVTQSSSAPNAATAGAQTAGTTAVQRRDLVATDTESGTISYANPQTVYNRLSGTITWLPSIGQVVQPGQALFKVNGEPVILLSGSTPAYRDLDADDSPGEDILELNRNLVALGFNPDGIVVDDVWQPATTAAVELFEESFGESPTASLSLGQVVFLPGAQVVSTVVATLGSDGGVSAAPVSSTSTPEARPPQFVSLTRTPVRPPSPRKPRPKPSQKARAAPTIPALIALLRAESAQLKAQGAELKAAEAAIRPHPRSGTPTDAGNSPSHDSSSSDVAGGNSGSGQASATPALQAASTRLEVTVDLDASKQSEAKVGEQVTIEMPAGNTVPGTVTAVSRVAQSSSADSNANPGTSSGPVGGSGSGNQSSNATIPVTIALSGHQSSAGLDQASVSVNFEQTKADNVLSVPVTALLATPGGDYAVQEAGTPHQLIPVTTGLFAAGYVQISGANIEAGLRVTNSQG